MIKKMYKFLLENVVLRAGDFVTKSAFLSTLNLYRNYCKHSDVELQNVQEKKIERLISILKTHPYYGKYNAKKISDFPILSKSTLNDNINSIAPLNKEKLVRISTSGSTGIKSTVYFTNKEVSVPRAIQTFWWEWSGYKLGNSILQFGVNTNRSFLKKIKDIVFRTKYISALNHSDEALLRELKRLQKKPRDHMFGFASSLYLLALNAEANNIKDVTFKSASSFGEKFSMQEKTKVNTVFKTRSFDTYGCAEGLLVAGTCEQGNYHIMTPHVYVELLDANNNEVAPGEVGRVVLTGLDNRSTPLVRYEVGDYAEKIDPNSTCQCGRPFPLLGPIHGRKSEVIKTKSGTLITVQTLTGIMKRISGVKQFQFHCDDEYNYQLHVVKSDRYDSNTESSIHASFFQSLNENIKLTINVVDEINVEKTGKFKFIVKK